MNDRRAEPEPFRHDPDDAIDVRVADAFEDQRLADHVGTAAEQPLPGRVRNDHVVVGGEACVGRLRLEILAEQRPHAEDLEEVG